MKYRCSVDVVKLEALWDGEAKPTNSPAPVAILGQGLLPSMCTSSWSYLYSEVLAEVGNDDGGPFGADHTQHSSELALLHNEQRDKDHLLVVQVEPCHDSKGSKDRHSRGEVPEDVRHRSCQIICVADGGGSQIGEVEPAHDRVEEQGPKRTTQRTPLTNAPGDRDEHIGDAVELDVGKVVHVQQLDGDNELVWNAHGLKDKEDERVEH